MISFLIERVRGVSVALLIAVSLAYAWLIIAWLPYWSRLEAVQGGVELQARFRYSAAEAAAALAAIDASARTDALAFYALDLLNAALYALAIAAMIAFGLRRLKLHQTAGKWLLILPLAAGAADIGENVTLALALHSCTGVLDVAPLFTTAKFALGYGAQAFAVVLGFAGLVTWAWGFIPRVRS